MGTEPVAASVLDARVVETLQQLSGAAFHSTLPDAAWGSGAGRNRVL